MSELIQKHGGYRKLKSFQVAQLCYDITVRSCDRYVDRFSRTKDQMVQAARSGVQNIAEGSQASATSKKTELKLTQVARASLEELKLDYEDFLRQRGLATWERSNPLRPATHRPALPNRRRSGRLGCGGRQARWTQWTEWTLSTETGIAHSVHQVHPVHPVHQNLPGNFRQCRPCATGGRLRTPRPPGRAPGSRF